MLNTRKIQQRFKHLLSVSSLSLVLLTGCPKGEGPAIEVCVGDAEKASFNCIGEHGARYDKLVTQMDGYIATNPEDFKELINYCKAKSRQ
jgi:hypothetical protein